MRLEDQSRAVMQLAPLLHFVQWLDEVHAAMRALAMSGDSRRLRAAACWPVVQPTFFANEVYLSDTDVLVRNGHDRRTNEGGRRRCRAAARRLHIR